MITLLNISIKSAIFRFWRFNRDVKKSNHPTSIVIARYDKEGIYDISGSFNEDSDNHHGKTLDVGYYVIWVYCNYDDCSEPKHESYQIRFFCNNEFKCRQVNSDSQFCLIRDIMIAGALQFHKKLIEEDTDGVYSTHHTTS